LLRIRRDDMYVTYLVFCAETCCALADPGHAESLYQLLRPYGRQPKPSYRCVLWRRDLYLAMLACTANCLILPRALDLALTLNRAMRAWPSLRGRYSGTVLFWQHGSRDRAAPGLSAAARADQLARRLGMTRLWPISMPCCTQGRQCHLSDDSRLAKSRFCVCWPSEDE